MRSSSTCVGHRKSHKNMDYSAKELQDDVPQIAYEAEYIPASYPEGELAYAAAVQDSLEKLPVRDYSIYSPVSINRMKSGAIRTNAKGLGLITERPLTGSAFDSANLLNAIVYGRDAKYFI